MFKDIIGKTQPLVKIGQKSNIFILFHNTIKTLIAVVEENKRQHAPTPFFCYDTYALEYGTVKCSAGRMTGKSDYIKRYADKDSLVIVPNARIMAGYPPGIFEICHVAQLTKYHKDIFKTIYIDEPSFVFKIASELFVYGILSKNFDQIYIQLG